MFNEKFNESIKNKDEKQKLVESMTDFDEIDKINFKTIENYIKDINKDKKGDEKIDDLVWYNPIDSDIVETGMTTSEAVKKLNYFNTDGKLIKIEKIGALKILKRMQSELEEKGLKMVFEFTGDDPTDKDKESQYDITITDQDGKIIKQEFDKRASDIFQEWLHENYNELIINGTLIAEQDDKTVNLIPKEKAA